MRDVQRFKLSYPINLAPSSSLWMCGVVALHLARPASWVRDTGDPSDTEAKPAFHFSGFGAPSLSKVLDMETRNIGCWGKRLKENIKKILQRH